MRSLLILTLIFCLAVPSLATKRIAPVQKTIPAHRATTKPKIDGVLDDAIWLDAPIATNFTQQDPDPGAAPMLKTEVRVAYDDNAIYIGAYMHDPLPDSIMRELTIRDNDGNTDWFMVILNPYADGINGFSFKVTAAGVQLDSKYSSNTTDKNWDGVWLSKVRIVENGWIAEIKIPYVSIRFPKTDIQNWNINFERYIRRVREKSYWNEIDPKIPGFLIQSGRLEGISNINAPLRLSLTPYISSTIEHFPLNTSGISDYSREVRGGMDVKLGMSESFTLDMTVIPDFGQVRSDNLILNLTPFEVFFQENRPFFMEGTELFRKGSIFYSRRIGGRPVEYFTPYTELADNESVIHNPETTQLLNATKISGRTKGGLGIGFFNSVTAETHATIRDTVTGIERQMITNPIVNYNVSVLDQTFNNQSFLTLINTNTIRRGSQFEDANVTATAYQFNDKNNNYGVRGDAAVSLNYDSVGSDPTIGHKYWVQFQKSAGNINFVVSHSEINESYDNNDLGFLTRNNRFTNNASIGFRVFKPWWKFNHVRGGLNVLHQMLYAPRKFQDFAISADVFGVTRTFQAGGLDFKYEPINTFDYFEPRIWGMFYEYPRNYQFSGWISTDYRKRFAVDIRLRYREWNENNRQVFFWRFSPRYRFSDRLLVILDFNNTLKKDDIGWAGFNDQGEVIFGLRDVNTVNSLLNARYIFTNRMGLTVRARHNWTHVHYNDFQLLGDDGKLYADNSFSRPNNNFNAFNIDMIYTWFVSPGSELNIVWKNAILTAQEDPEYGYITNLDGTWASPQRNSILLKFIYYLDYQVLKNGW